MKLNENLNEIMDIDHVVRVNPDRTVSDAPGVYAPELRMQTLGDEYGSILDEHEEDFCKQAEDQGGWEVLRGFTGQYSYNGVVMHPSEFIGGYLEDHILDHPGLYVAVVVETDDDDEPAGWAVLYREK